MAGIMRVQRAGMQVFQVFRERVWSKRICLIAILAFFAGIVGLVVGRNYVGSVSIVTGPSMAPTYEEGSRVFTTPILGSVCRGDVVVVDDGSKGYAIKRIVGLPGETVCLWRGRVFIGRRILLEPYLPKRVYTLRRQGRAVFELGAAQYFVLGDNRSDSSDSRVYGPVERKQIKRRISLPEGAARPFLGPVKLPVLSGRGKS